MDINIVLNTEAVLAITIICLTAIGIVYFIVMSRITGKRHSNQDYKDWEK